MKKALLYQIPNEMPQEIRHFVSGARIYDMSSSPEAKVYFIDKGNGYYLKCANRGMLEKEFRMTAVIGEDCVHEGYLENPEIMTNLISRIVLATAQQRKPMLF